MKYVVLHREGTQWFNRVGNSLHVPFIEAGTPEEAVEQAIASIRAQGLDGEAPMYLVMSKNGWWTLSPQSGWKVDDV